jgi:hypothetical protein
MIMQDTNDRKERTMYITIDMLTDPMFWVGLPVFMFFMGGKYSPLSIFKWYRTFWKSIGFKDIS